jgi:hypothetical protein
METMFLVVGLAVAGLVGIAAAFYFSIRSGNRDRRMRSAGTGHAGTGRHPGNGSGTARPDQAGHSFTAANGDRPVTKFTPAAVSPRKPRAEQVRAADSRPDHSWPGDPSPDDAYAADGAAGPADAADPARPRRRVGFRKGADLDEELWPAETFGGVSDEQFWDDLASDKPLATTARTAQHSPRKNRLVGGAPSTGLDTGSATGPQAVLGQADGRKRDDRDPGRGRRASGTGTYAGPLTAPDLAAERTVTQPAHAATQPIQSMKSQLPAATQPVRVAASTSQPRGAATQPAQPPQPTETRRRRPSSAEEDPLTSAAFSLRPSGPVDGRSSLRARTISADRFDSSSPHLYPAPSYRDSSSVTQTMATPPSGLDYGYRPGDRAAQAGEPRRQNGTRSHARPDGSGQGSGGYPGNGYPGNGYPGNGHRGNGHRAPYDPRDDYRRLTPER